MASRGIPTHQAAQAEALLESPVWRELRQRMERRVLNALANRTTNVHEIQALWAAFGDIEREIKQMMARVDDAEARAERKQKVI